MPNVRFTPAKVAGAGAAGALAAAATLIASFEGFVPHTYADPVGIPTVCYGHTGVDVRYGQRYTPEACLALLEKDVFRHADAITPCLRRPVPAPVLTAFVSFSYNVGPGAFCKSSVARLFNAGNTRGACAALSKWVYAGGKVLPGLVRRRAAERATCERGLSHEAS